MERVRLMETAAVLKRALGRSFGNGSVSQAEEIVDAFVSSRGDSSVPIDDPAALARAALNWSRKGRQFPGWKYSSGCALLERVSKMDFRSKAERSSRQTLAPAFARS